MCSHDQAVMQTHDTYQCPIRKLFSDVPHVESAPHMRFVANPLDEYVWEVMETYKDSPYYQLKDGESATTSPSVAEPSRNLFYNFATPKLPWSKDVSI